MIRVGDVALGAGVVVCLLALTATAASQIRDVLRVERERRERARRAPLVVGGGQSARPDTADAVAAPPSDVVVDEIGRTVRRVYADICDGWDQ